MEALSIGPFVLSYQSAAALVAGAVFLIVGEILGRRGNQKVNDWASAVLLVGLVAARAGYVVTHWPAYARDPWSIIYVWQGGFDPLWGFLVAGGYTLFFFRAKLSQIRGALVPTLVAAVVFLAVSGWGSAQGGSYELPPQKLAALEGPDLSVAELEGKPLVINIWATWCPPCRRELPMMAEVAEESRGVQFVFMSQGEAEDTVASFLESEGLELPLVLLDQKNEISRHFRAFGLPTTIFFNAEGEYVGRKIGEISRAELSDWIEKINVQPTVAPEDIVQPVS